MTDGTQKESKIGLIEADMNHSIPIVVSGEVLYGLVLSAEIPGSSFLSNDREITSSCQNTTKIVFRFYKNATGGNERSSTLGIDESLRTVIGGRLLSPFEDYMYDVLVESDGCPNDMFMTPGMTGYLGATIGIPFCKCYFYSSCCTILSCQIRTGNLLQITILYLRNSDVK
jgi:hypothetical protein